MGGGGVRYQRNRVHSEGLIKSFAKCFKYEGKRGKRRWGRGSETREERVKGMESRGRGGEERKKGQRDREREREVREGGRERKKEASKPERSVTQSKHHNCYSRPTAAPCMHMVSTILFTNRQTERERETSVSRPGLA